jgi:hypothetical protein
MQVYHDFGIDLFVAGARATLDDRAQSLDDRAQSRA